jgi:thiol:disulfide interchange protein DsbA
MKRPFLLLPALLAALLLAACNNAEAPAAGDAANTEASAPAGTSPSAEAQAAAASAAAAEGASVAGEPAAPADADAADATPADADAHQADPSGLVEGRDYELIRNGEPWMPLNGKVEVVEVFGYVCPACARIEPLFSRWEDTLPADVRVSFVPAPFGPQWTPYAKAFYVAESLGLVDRTHTPMFHAIHIEDSLPGEGETPDEAAIAQWYGKFGADPKQFRAAMDSFSTTAKVNRGRQFMVRTGVTGTPTIVVNGKYRVTGGRSYEDVLKITDQLIQKARAEAGATS